MSEAAQQSDAWQTSVENRLSSTDQHLMELGKKIDKCFYIGIAAIAAVGIEGLWLYNRLSDQLTALQLAATKLTP